MPLIDENTLKTHCFCTFDFKFKLCPLNKWCIEEKWHMKYLLPHHSLRYRLITKIAHTVRHICLVMFCHITYRDNELLSLQTLIFHHGRKQKNDHSWASCVQHRINCQILAMELSYLGKVKIYFFSKKILCHLPGHYHFVCKSCYLIKV